MNSKAWNDGFEAGQAFLKHCPYLPDSDEEWDWHAAWLEGAAKALGWNHCENAEQRQAKHGVRRTPRLPAAPAAPDFVGLVLAMFESSVHTMPGLQKGCTSNI